MNRVRGSRFEGLAGSLLLTPSPLGDCVVMRANAVIPSEAGIQVFEIVEVYNILDARLREHDELGHSHLRGRGDLAY